MAASGDPVLLAGPLPPPLLFFLYKGLLFAPRGEFPMDDPPGDDPGVCGEPLGDEPAPVLALK